MRTTLPLSGGHGLTELCSSAKQVPPSSENLYQSNSEGVPPGTCRRNTLPRTSFHSRGHQYHWTQPRETHQKKKKRNVSMNTLVHTYTRPLALPSGLWTLNLGPALSAGKRSGLMKVSGQSSRVKQNCRFEQLFVSPPTPEGTWCTYALQKLTLSGGT